MIFPRATYRLQLRAGFGFNEAAAVAPVVCGSQPVAAKPRPASLES